MKINYRGHEQKSKESLERCIEIANDYNSGMAIDDICKKYPNKKTKKPCSRVYVYWALKKAKTL